MTTKELEERYGPSEPSTDVIDLGHWSLGANVLFKDGKRRKLMHIEYRNMAVDLLRFDDGAELFTGDLASSFA